MAEEHRKWKVLIVDDEMRIGQLIKKLIHWDEYDLECVDVVDNGERALEIICSENCPDILITDIRMPKINGLDLIRAAKELKDNVHFIVVSGYREFEYARMALQYGVEEYLLKPISETDLNRMMEKLSGALGECEAKRSETENLKEDLYRSKQIIKRNYLRNIIDQNNNVREENSPVPIGGDVYRGIDIKLDYADYATRDEKQDRMMVEMVRRTVEKLLTQEAEEVLICEKEHLHIYCLFSYSAEHSRQIRTRISDILAEICAYLMGYEQYDITIGVGGERTEFSDIRFSIAEAYRAVCSRLRLGTGRLIYAEADDEKLPTALNAQQKETLRTAAEGFSAKSLSFMIFRMFTTPEDRKIDCTTCYELAEDLISEFLDCVVPEENRSVMRKTILSELWHCTSFPSFRNCLSMRLGKCLEDKRSEAEMESSRPVRTVQQFVEEHYGDKIILEDMADLVGLNAAYFSALFKKETGINFSTYLVELRIEKAKELLRSTNETIAAIGDMVGYKDARYFSQTFTKQVGLKPALYRKLHA